MTAAAEAGEGYPHETTSQGGRALAAGEIDLADHHYGLARTLCVNLIAPCYEAVEWSTLRFGYGELPFVDRGLVRTPLGLGTRGLSLDSSDLFEPL